MRNRRMMNKKAFEFSFAWLFAIIVGAVIIFLAVYASTKLIKTQRTIQDTELGKELGIILNPIETSFETGKAQKISFPFQTRIFNDCKTISTFGLQKLSTSTKSQVGEWQSSGEQSTFYNKYLFSENVIEGKDYIVFSKPFEMPFKIADLIYIWPETERYCLVNPPREIEDEINDLKLETINIASKQSECPAEAKKVCFISSGCDIDITLDTSASKIKGSAKKKALDRVYFESPALLYGAIFASPSLYECQVTRLMKRASELSWLYYSKTSFLSSKGCSSNLEADLLSYANQTFSINSSSQLRSIAFNSENIGRKNNELNCQLF